jgi:hypothetical protein
MNQYIPLSIIIGFFIFCIWYFWSLVKSYNSYPVVFDPNLNSIWFTTRNKQIDRPHSRRSNRLQSKSTYNTNYPYALIIIDMQEQFDASRDKNTIRTIQKMITDAKRDGAFIIIAHYMRCGQTRPEIRKMIQGYPYADSCYSNQDDKSQAIYTKLLRYGIQTDIFKICGVNTEACVMSTIFGLTDLYPNTHILVSFNGCNCECSNHDVCEGRYVSQLPNVSSVY